MIPGLPVNAVWKAVQPKALSIYWKPGKARSGIGEVSREIVEADGELVVAAVDKAKLILPSGKR